MFEQRERAKKCVGRSKRESVKYVLASTISCHNYMVISMHNECDWMAHMCVWWNRNRPGQSLHDIQLHSIQSIHYLPSAKKTIFVHVETNRCMQACMQLTTPVEYLNSYNIACWLVFPFKHSHKRCFQEDPANCWSFTQFCWFICFGEKRVVVIDKKRMNIAHFEHQENLDNQKIKFESKIAKIRKSNYPYGMCVYEYE